MEELIKKMKELVEIQGKDGNWDYDEYMRGMFNGMELMLAIAEDREPRYRHSLPAVKTNSGEIMHIQV